jgi:hypothetical protein
MIQAPVSPSPPPAPDPGQIAQQNSVSAASACKRQFPFSAGSLTNRAACIDQAVQQYLYPIWSEGQKAIHSRFEKYIQEATNLVDDRKMSLQEYLAYARSANEIDQREWDASDQEDEMLDPDPPGRNSLNYDMEQGNQQDVEADEHNIAIYNLQNEQQAISDARDEYEYCAGLHTKDLSACAAQMVAVQTDLAMYQAMASNVPQVEQQEAPSPAQTLQQQEIQDDLDIIAGGAVP